MFITKYLTFEISIPTSELAADGSIMSWDECLPDCPHETTVVVCLSDPIPPMVVTYGGEAVNFTTTYEFNVEATSRELDLVEYSCPEGYLWDGTNEVTFYSMCHNWTWINSFPSDVICVRKY